MMSYRHGWWFLFRVLTDFSGSTSSETLSDRTFKFHIPISSHRMTLSQVLKRFWWGSHSSIPESTSRRVRHFEIRGTSCVVSTLPIVGGPGESDTACIFVRETSFGVKTTEGSCETSSVSVRGVSGFEAIGVDRDVVGGLSSGHTG